MANTGTDNINILERSEKLEIETNFKEIEKNLFKEWITNCVLFDVSQTTSFSELYDNYCIFLLEDQKGIAMGRNTFSKELKKEWIKYMNKGKIKFILKSKIFYQGVVLKNSYEKKRPNNY
jgi:hypothetical protein